MKVNENGGVNSVQPYKKATAYSKTEKYVAGDGRTDELSISSEAMELSRDRTNAVERERVEQIKQAVQSGTYTIDVHKIADKMARYLLGE
ncbi:flagellar biosynthesis anti-sigma factor FlgM [Effusibacillus dendaii]|uniref:Negative regulator of flagellin synthesis n=1 Tax=Effusibacillus dendaii TaxID=2743772 RepID=A0A7I8DEZ3_9BACL|nr:flagellar biosynthesis anti-sigma factor FlgM [Effusibacillus dendaii]BCJ87862.1 hypothetical protein skT53_28470 [Effusibacillus dendaii]